MSRTTTEHIRWHHSDCTVDGHMVHPADRDAWKHFNDTHLTFANETRNVRLGLCKDGFNPFGPTKVYSCWLVFLTPYNLPPWMCMKDPYIYLSQIIPRSKSPRKNIDVYLRPLVDELKQL